MLHHLLMAVLPLLDFCFHIVAWPPSLIIYAKLWVTIQFMFITILLFVLGFFFATYLNPYNSCLFIFNSSQKKFTNFEFII